MSEIVDAVAKKLIGKIYSDDYDEAHRAASPMDLETAREIGRLKARAAIKATMEHLRDNVSDGMIEEGRRFIDSFYGEHADARNTFTAMLSQALLELES